MPTQLKNAALILGVVVVVFANHNLPRVASFRRDPYDAVWAFTFFTIALVVVVSIVRAFRLYPLGPASAAQSIYAIRLQQAFALAVFMTFVANVIALARHPSTWISAASRNRLLAWLGIFAAVVLATELVILAGQRTLRQDAPSHWKRVALVLAAAMLLLVLCPEWPSDNNSQTAHILTVALGALVVFVPIRILLPVLVPFEPYQEHRRRKICGTASEWSAFLAGILMFAFGFWADTHRWAGTLRFMRPFLAIAPFLVAYALLGKPLGLVPTETRVSRSPA